MTAARVILGLIMAGTVVSNWLVWHWGWQESGWAMAWMVASAALFVAAVTVMAITLVNFQQKNGRFVLDSNSWIARIMGWGRGDKVTICSLFWTTVLLISAAVVGFVLLLTGLFAATEAGWVETIRVVLFVVATVAGIVLLVVGAANAEDYVGTKMRQGSTVWRGVGNIATYVLPVVTVVILLAVLGFIIYDAGVVKFFTGLVLVCLIVGGAFGLVFGVVAGVKSIRESAVGKILSSGWHHVKSRTCPVVSVMDLK
ncbi:MAG: hypothetical protein Q8P76_04195 [bacterium]|nr:hypothetical protein [bacterium]